MAELQLPGRARWLSDENSAGLSQDRWPKNQEGHANHRHTAVSYTHLDVYKRQVVCCTFIVLTKYAYPRFTIIRKTFSDSEWFRKNGGSPSLPILRKLSVRFNKRVECQEFKSKIQQKTKLDIKYEDRYS